MQKTASLCFCTPDKISICYRIMQKTASLCFCTPDKISICYRIMQKTASLCFCTPDKISICYRIMQKTASLCFCTPDKIFDLTIVKRAFYGNMMRQRRRGKRSNDTGGNEAMTQGNWENQRPRLSDSSCELPELQMMRCADFQHPFRTIMGSGQRWDARCFFVDTNVTNAHKAIFIRLWSEEF
ncbi:Uncharacterized protein dnm_069430 [Desulfonema magnum]|uniref:Uncharacterized protein n=1 Tax=Desulfonema magnum TaxID=45655 RepID=A0A975GRC2_9BACT|nr:Uncharacterized protein dnm_069430 [Desulfonema magnum]